MGLPHSGGADDVRTPGHDLLPIEPVEAVFTSDPEKPAIVEGDVPDLPWHAGVIGPIASIALLCGRPRARRRQGDDDGQSHECAGSHHESIIRGFASGP